MDPKHLGTWTKEGGGGRFLKRNLGRDPTVMSVTINKEYQDRRVPSPSSQLAVSSLVAPIGSLTHHERVVLTDACVERKRTGRLHR